MAADEIRKIVHIDMDAFYASVEQRDNPDLQGRPVAVGHGARRGVVAAASYEARRFGVRSAKPAATARRKCPELIFAPPRPEVYRAVSRQIHRIFADYTDVIEPLSLDEAYLDVTEDRRGLSTASATAKEIRGRILAQTGLTASAGISYNKFIAKLACDQRKPNGQYVVPPEHGAAFVQSMPIGRFHGVGAVTEARMKGFGIHTGEDLHRQSLDFLVRQFGKSGSWFYGVARGQDSRRVNPDRVRKSSGSETTFEQDFTAREPVEAGVLAMADDVWAWCEKTGARARTVTVKIKWADFQQASRSRTLAHVVGDLATLRQTSLDLIRSVFPPRLGIRLVGVTLSSFDQDAALGDEQLGLGLGDGEGAVEAEPAPAVSSLRR
jgi:DNA polymerase-4